MLHVSTIVLHGAAATAVCLGGAAMGVKYIRDSNDVRARQMWELRRTMAQATCYEDWTRAAKQLDQLVRDHPACAPRPSLQSAFWL